MLDGRRGLGAKTMATKGYYSAIQYCPDRSRMEAANVGVMLLCPQIPGTGKPCWTLDDPANSHLISLGFKTLQPADAATLWPRGTAAV